jgi:hypothetical protein
LAQVDGHDHTNLYFNELYAIQEALQQITSLIGNEDALRLSRCDPLIALCKQTDPVYQRFIANVMKYRLVMSIKDESMFDEVKYKTQ